MPTTADGMQVTTAEGKMEAAECGAPEMKNIGDPGPKEAKRFNRECYEPGL